MAHRSPEAEHYGNASYEKLRTNVSNKRRVTGRSEHRARERHAT